MRAVIEGTFVCPEDHYPNVLPGFQIIVQIADGELAADDGGSAIAVEETRGVQERRQLWVISVCGGSKLFGLALDLVDDHGAQLGIALLLVCSVGEIEG